MKIIYPPGIRLVERAGYLAVLIIIVTTSACKLNDDNRLKIAWHNLLARDNIWFNANENLKEAKNLLRNQQEDKYDRILDLMTYGSEAQRKSLVNQMDETVRKAQKIMAKHYISVWMDDAYLVTGQAQFLKNDFSSAIETFQYLNTRYKNSVLRFEAMLWIAKCYIMMGRPDDAESLSGLIRSEKNWPKGLNADRSVLAAQIELSQGKLIPASYRLREAITQLGIFQRYEKARYSFILGQVYQRLEKYDSANYYFKRCIKYNPPYVMAFYAKMNLAKAYNANRPGEAKGIRRYLKSMLRDDKNIPFFDQIYYELGLLSLREKNETEAIRFFKLSATSSQGNKDQKAKTFQALADYFFSKKPKPDYKYSQAYYDSTAQFVTRENPDYEKIMTKKEVLNELIRNLVIIEEQDSLLRISNYPSAKLDKLLDRIIDEQQKNKNETGSIPQYNQSNSNNGQPTVGGSGWYFSNTTLLGSGFTEFQRKYGDRKNIDYWRILAKASENIAINPEISDSLETGNSGSDHPLYKNASKEKRKILDLIPFSDKQKKVSEDNIANAMASVGDIYYENLEDDDAAEDILRQLVLRYPGFPKSDKVFYQLYKISFDRKDTVERNRYKNIVLTKFPNSPYAKILRKEGLKDKESEAAQEIIVFYNLLYKFFEEKKYAEMRKGIIEARKKWPNNPVQPKYDLLDAMASAYTDSLSVYENLLAQIELKHNGSDEADRAKRLLSALKKYREVGIDTSLVNDTINTKNQPKIKQKGEYTSQYSSRYFYIMLIPGKNTNTSALQNALADFNQTNYVFENLEVKSMILDDEYQLIRIIEFKDKSTLLKYIDDIRMRTEITARIGLKELIHFGITDNNFVLLFNTKDWEGYLEFFKNKF